MQEELSARERSMEEMRLRDRYLTLINMTIRDILSPNNIDDRYHYLEVHLTNLFVADYAYFVRWDATQEQAILAEPILPSEKPASDILLKPDESEITVSALRTGRVQVIEDVPNSGQVVNLSHFQKFSLSPQSALCIPFIVREHKLGAAIIAYDTPHHFSTEEISSCGICR